MKTLVHFSIVIRTVLISLSLLSAASPTAFAVSPSGPIVVKYPENGNWYVRVIQTDSEGFPDTVEKSAFATEQQAEERLQAIKISRGIFGASRAIERSATASEENARELRNPPAGEIWTAKEEWSAEWEDRFADWTRENFDKKFFKRYRIETDCADATVALRWIYSRIMGLPAGNRLGDALMTNRSVRSIWQKLPTADNWYEDRRFLAALDYVLDNTYTHSIHADSYPIEINDKWLREGAFHLELRAEDGHTRVFTNISHDGSGWPIQDMWSNVPRKVRKLVVEPFTVFIQPPMKFGGILRHRWVRLAESSAYLVPAEQMPGYSLEQYQPDFFKHGAADFSAEVAARMRDTVDPVVGLKAVLSNLERSIKERKKLVADGHALCSKQDCSPGTKNYEDWSTPSRDARLGQYFEQVASYIGSIHGGDLDRAKTLLEKEKKKKLLRFGGKKYRYPDIEAVWAAKKFSSDPRDPPTKRWGF